MIKISIIIRAFNEEKNIERLLYGIENQKNILEYEIILVDSGSEDKTVDIASNHGVKVIHISPNDFSFGHSLNKGIGKADGDICVFISAHCYPEHDEWLMNLIKPIINDNSIALVYGKQRGNKITRYAERQIFSNWFPNGNDGKQHTPFCNNANLAIRKELWHRYKYNEDLTGLEDIDWAKYFISRGYAVYYAPAAGIIHVHEETYQQIYRRYKREAMALKKISPQESFTLLDFTKFFILNTITDYMHAYRDGVFLKNFIDIYIMRFIQFFATYRGHTYQRPVSSELKNKFYYPRKPVLFKTPLGKDD